MMTLFSELLPDASGMTHHIRMDLEDDGALSFFVDGKNEVRFAASDMDALVAGGTVTVAGRPFSMPEKLREDWKRIQGMFRILREVEELKDILKAAQAEELRQEAELSDMLHHPVAQA